MKFEDEGTSIKITRKWAPIFASICARGGEASGESVMFDQMTGLWTLAAAVGVRQNRKCQLGPVEKTLKWQFFNADTEQPVLAALAWKVSNGNLSVLRSARSIVDTLEEFVEGGLEFLGEDVFHDCFGADNTFEVRKASRIDKSLLAVALELGDQAPI